MQHLEVFVLDLAQERAVNAGHHQPGLLCAPILGGQQRQGLVVQPVGAFGLEAHECRETLGILALEDFVRLHVELLQLVHRQVDAPAQGVLAHVADDVGHLQRLPEAVCVVGGRRFLLAEDARCHFTHHARHEVAVALQAGVVEVAGLFQVHLAALDDRQQVAWLDAVVCGVRHQRLHHRVRGLALEGLRHLAAPPGELVVRDARVGHFIDHVVHLAAETIKGRDGRAPGAGQEQKGVIEAAARGGSLLLDVLFRIHGGRLSHGVCMLIFPAQTGESECPTLVSVFG